MSWRDENEAAHRLALRAVEAAWAVGCPVAGGDSTDQAAIARRAVRRWNSALRRGIAADERIADLARGLIDGFEARPELVGPLARDYEYLAAQIAAAMQAEPPSA